MAILRRKGSGGGDDLQTLLAKKEFKKAIPILQDAASAQPKNSAVRLHLADTLLADNQIDDSVREYRTLADLYTEEGFIVKAIAIYKKILKLKPDMAEVEELLEGLSEKRSGRFSRTKKQPITQEIEIIQPEIVREPDIVSEEPAPAPEPLIISEEPPPRLEIEMKLFPDLSPEEFRRIVDGLTLQHFEEDTIVVQEGDPGDSMFIIAHGEVRVLTRDSDDREVVLAHLGEGDFFGEVALLTGRPRTATIITNQSSELLELKKEDFERIIGEHPHVRSVVEEFHQQRAYKTIEAMIQSLRNRG